VYQVFAAGKFFQNSKATESAEMFSVQVTKLKRRSMSRFSIKGDAEQTLGFDCP
jgi:hypothetical protein